MTRTWNKQGEDKGKRKVHVIRPANIRIRARGKPATKYVAPMQILPCVRGPRFLRAAFFCIQSGDFCVRE